MWNIALVTGRSRLRGQDRRTVVVGEGLDLRVEVGIERIRSDHRGLQVVGDQRTRHAAEVSKGVLDAADEIVGRLAEDGFAVGLA